MTLAGTMTQYPTCRRGFCPVTTFIIKACDDIIFCASTGHEATAPWKGGFWSDERAGETCWVTLNQWSFIYIGHQLGNSNVNGCAAALWIFVDLMSQRGGGRKGERESFLLMICGFFLSCLTKGRWFAPSLNPSGNGLPGISVALLPPRRLSKVIIATVSLDPSLSWRERTKGKWWGSGFGHEPPATLAFVVPPIATQNPRGTYRLLARELSFHLPKGQGSLFPFPEEPQTGLRSSNRSMDTEEIEPGSPDCCSIPAANKAALGPTKDLGVIDGLWGW